MQRFTASLSVTHIPPGHGVRWMENPQWYINICIHIYCIFIKINIFWTERGEGHVAKGPRSDFNPGRRSPAMERVVACGPTELNWHRYILHNF